MSDNAARIRGLYEAFAAGDVGTVLAAFDPQIEWHEAEHVTFWPGGPFHGVEAVVAGVLTRIGETFGTSFRIEPARIHAAGDTVIMEGRYFGVVQSNGREISAQVAHVWDLQGDKIVRFQQYTDTWQFAQATGIEPVTAAAATS